MENEPTKRNNPAFDPKQIEEAELRRLLDAEARYLENQRLIESETNNNTNNPASKDLDIKPGLVEELLADTDPQAQ